MIARRMTVEHARRAAWLLPGLAMLLSGPVLAAELPLVPRWKRVELTFQSEIAYTNPPGISLQVEFRTPQGETQIVPGFWDGGNFGGRACCRAWRVVGVSGRVALTRTTRVCTGVQASSFARRNVLAGLRFPVRLPIGLALLSRSPARFLPG